MHLRLPALAMLAALLAPGPGRAGQAEISVAVMEFASKGGIAQDKSDALSDMLANEIRAQGPYKVVGKSDIQAALAMEEQKQLIGCSDDSCIAEIGGALGVRWIVVGNVSLFGSTYLLNLKLLDVTTIKVMAGISRKITGGEDMLIDGLGAAARELIGEARAKMSSADAGDKTASDDKPKDGAAGGSGALTSFGPQDAEVAASAPSKAKTYKMWGHVTFWTGAGLGIVGIAGAAFGAKRAKDYKDPDWTVNPYDAPRALDESRIGASLMYAGLFSGVALMATGTVLWVLASKDEEPTAEASVGLGPTPGGDGAVLGISGRW